MDLKVDVLTLAVTTVITGAVGWGVKLLLDALKGYIAQSSEWRSAMDARMEANEKRRDETHAENERRRELERVWREKVDQKFDDQDSKIDAILSAQCTQMRSDLIHRAHHYVSVVGCATVDEKDSFHAEWKEYQALCKAYNIENSFIDNIVKQVMALPDTSDGGIVPAYANG